MGINVFNNTNNLTSTKTQTGANKKVDQIKALILKISEMSPEEQKKLFFSEVERLDPITLDYLTKIETMSPADPFHNFRRYKR